MSIRLRLALWYASLFALVLLLVTLLSYAFHVRGHYDDRDRALITSAGHMVSEADTMPGGPHLLEGRGGLEVGFRLYGPDGTLRERTADVELLPPLDPRTVLAEPSGPPYDALARLSPPLVASDGPTAGAFGVLVTPEQRWRVYVLPIDQGSAIAGYLETLTPLGRLDASIEAYRTLLLALGLAGVATALLGGWAIAGGALRPIAHMTQTAGTITHSHDPSHRILMPQQCDELGQLAETFNEMLASIETAYGAQQRFVADASHELRAPLTGIQGNLELLRRHPDMPSADRDEALGEAEREAGRLARLVADLLALARADAGVALQRRSVALDEVVLDAFRTARQLARGQELVLDPFEPAQVVGDEDRLKQLLLILLDNALKYTPAGGRVTLGLRHLRTEAEVLVCDTGVGIGGEDLPHVFERFYRADPARNRDSGGTGLGLPIAHWIAQQHGGDVTLESKLDQGTTATVRLPLVSIDPSGVVFAAEDDADEDVTSASTPQETGLS
ncbi:MAG TPA: HAMP domain-containing sensor histidine kinase [Roseiflexaceae bacterium]|nr:HAMP domain-containing sensor histidine kinase [Roseiflexaceae bacterium]